MPRHVPWYYRGIRQVTFTRVYSLNNVQRVALFLSSGGRQGASAHLVRAVREHVPEDERKLPPPVQGRQGNHPRWRPVALQGQQIPPRHQELHASGGERKRHYNVVSFFFFFLMKFILMKIHKIWSLPQTYHLFSILCRGVVRQSSMAALS